MPRQKRSTFKIREYLWGGRYNVHQGKPCSAFHISTKDRLRAFSNMQNEVIF